MRRGESDAEHVTASGQVNQIAIQDHDALLYRSDSSPWLSTATPARTHGAVLEHLDVAGRVSPDSRRQARSSPAQKTPAPD